MQGVQERGTPARTDTLPASVALVNGSSCPATALSETAQEALGPKEAIRKLFAEGDAAWNRGDLIGAVEGYWNSPDTTLFTGKDVTKGWQAILEYFQRRYGKEMGKLTTTEIALDMFDPETALFRCRWSIVFSELKRLDGMGTALLKKTPDGWRIVHDHGSIG